jgi:hypothetical protein
MRRGAPYIIRDTDGQAFTPDQAQTIIAGRWTVPPRSAPATPSPRRRSVKQVRVLQSHALTPGPAAVRPPPSGYLMIRA